MSGPTNIRTRSDMEELLSRSRLYGMLALLYRHPAFIDEDRLKEESEDWEDVVAALHIPDRSSLATSIRSLMNELQRTDARQRNSFYEDSFSHTAHGNVSAYELEYGEEHTHRQPQQLGDIAAFYRAFGLKVNEESHERVDHISVECEFMHFISFKEAYAWDSGLPEQAQTCREASRRFLAEHLGAWAPSFAQRLSRYVKEGPYKHLAEATLSFIVQDCQRQGIEPGPGDLPARAVNEKMDAGCVSCSLKAGFSC